MDTISKICECQDAIKEQLDIYEQCTEQMLTCDFDDIDHYITKRNELAIVIDQFNDEIFALSQMEPDSDVLMDAVKNSCDYDALPESYLEIYRKGQEVFSKLNRIMGMQERIIQRLQSEKQATIVRIQGLKEDGQVKKYLTNLVGTQGSGVYMSDKKV